ncbi:hypothetical protein CEXT_170071 [Caerostris extrusa]|uniref:Uncharacterized protein n=1 Tax=Caerostris extrusa TaxID=172846 RepID=A0AAV4XQC4_CAEEX|nr:hypothetical protein CEXT_170071 [Caerostris extrusa]
MILQREIWLSTSFESPDDPIYPKVGMDTKVDIGVTKVVNSECFDCLKAKDLNVWSDEHDDDEHEHDER